MPSTPITVTSPALSPFLCDKEEAPARPHASAAHIEQHIPAPAPSSAPASDIRDIALIKGFVFKMMGFGNPAGMFIDGNLWWVLQLDQSEIGKHARARIEL